MNGGMSLMRLSVRISSLSVVGYDEMMAFGIDVSYRAHTHKPNHRHARTHIRGDNKIDQCTSV